MRRSGQTRGNRRERLHAIREIVGRYRVGSQNELVGRLRARGFTVTQATVSRDIAELGLVKVARGGGHVYLSRADVAAGSSDDALARLLADVPATVGRSGLILVLTGGPGTAPLIGEAIDRSTLSEQEGTLAGDNTLLVLFADEARLERWLARFRALQGDSERTPDPAPSVAPGRGGQR